MTKFDKWFSALWSALTNRFLPECSVFTLLVKHFVHKVSVSHCLAFSPFQFPFPVSCFLYCCFAVLTLLSHLFLSYTWACSFILISFILNLWLVSRTGWSFPSFFVFTVVCGCVLWRHCCYATGSQSCLNYIGEGLIWPFQAFHTVHHFVCSERWRLIRWHLYL